MASSLSRLVKDTAWYGVSTILGRLLNWLLVPFYVRVLDSTGQYGVVTNLYAWTALLLVLLTYGMETGFFRYINGAEDPKSIYRTSLRSLLVSSSLFVILVGIIFSRPLSLWLIDEDRPSLILMMSLIIASDAFMAIPYAYLRYKKHPKRFAFIKLTFVAANILFNFFFLLLCPYIYKVYPSWISWFYEPSHGVTYILLSNLLANAIVLAMLIPYIRIRGAKVSLPVLKQMLGYSLPLMLLGIAGIFNQMADKILFPLLISDKEEAMSQLGIYGGCLKIAVVMVLFTQAFRYAFEPFFFEKDSGDDESSKKLSLATVMKYFWLFMLIVFLAVSSFLPILKYFVVPAYYDGLPVVPWVMWGEMMMGIALNLSSWYKLSDKTLIGAFISIIGCILGVALIVLGVPRYGFMACAWAIAISNTAIVILSYFIGKRYYPVPYDLKSGFGYLLLAAVGYIIIHISNQSVEQIGVWRWFINISVCLLFTLIVLRREKPLRLAVNKIVSKITRR